jgi:putative transposase
MDEAHLFAAIRYVSLNPVRARLVARPEDWPWSSVRAHFAGRDDGVVKVAPVQQRIEDFVAFLGTPFDEDATYAALRSAETIGRPLGSEDWIVALEHEHGRKLAPGRRGRKPRGEIDVATTDLFGKLLP